MVEVSVVPQTGRLSCLFSFIPSGQADASGFRGTLFILFLYQSSTELDIESDGDLICSKHEMLCTHNSLEYCAQKRL
jgi:hypothetical protein